MRTISQSTIYNDMNYNIHKTIILTIIDIQTHLNQKASSYKTVESWETPDELTFQQEERNMNLRARERESNCWIEASAASDIRAGIRSFKMILLRWSMPTSMMF